MPRLHADTVADSLAVYALDTVKLGASWQVIAGARWDRFDVDYRADRYSTTGVYTGSEQIERVDEEWSYRFGVVFSLSSRLQLYTMIGLASAPARLSIRKRPSGAMS